MYGEVHLKSLQLTPLPQVTPSLQSKHVSLECTCVYIRVVPSLHHENSQWHHPYIMKIHTHSTNIITLLHGLTYMDLVLHKGLLTWTWHISCCV